MRRYKKTHAVSIFYVYGPTQNYSHQCNRFVFAHTDFHPWDTMVVDGTSGIVELSGIILHWHWEVNGLYPGYSIVKAMNTRSIKGNSDWSDHLLPCILGYNRAVMDDGVIDKR
jgi:hypothetical protein